MIVATKILWIFSARQGPGILPTVLLGQVTNTSALRVQMKIIIIRVPQESGDHPMTMIEPVMPEDAAASYASEAALDERQLVWLMVLGSVARQPVPLATVVSRIEGVIMEGMVMGEGTIRSASACLQEMARGGHITLTSDGRRWMVAAGPRTCVTWSRLAGSDPYRLSPSLKRVFDRLIDFFGRRLA